jgi:hypothetical protein
MAEARRTVIKEVKDPSGRVVGKLYSDKTILIKYVIFSYPHVFTTYAGKNADGTPGTPKFSVTGLGQKATHVSAKNLCKEVGEALLAENNVKRLADDRKFYRNGDAAAKDGYDGMFTFSASESAERPPFVRGPDGSPWDKTKAQRIYGGCVGNMLVRPWFQADKGNGIRINAGLVGVQFVRDGEPFGNARISEDEIADTFENEGDDEGSHVDTDDL